MIGYVSVIYDMYCDIRSVMWYIDPKIDPVDQILPRVKSSVSVNSSRLSQLSWVGKTKV